MKKVKSNLLDLNVYTKPYVDERDYLVDKYSSLDFVQEPTGVREYVHDCPYPITPDYVRSFAEGCDYRTDLNSAVNAPARGKNLGDVRAAQDFNKMDSFEISKQFSDIKNKIENPAPAGEPASAGEPAPASMEVK